MRNESTSANAPGAAPAARSWGVLLNSAIVMVGYVLSRILGLIRESVISSQFGTSAVTDAYRAAFKIPDFLYLVIIGGALGSAFIPVFSDLHANEGARRAWRMTNAVVNLALLALSASSLVIMIWTRPFLNLLFTFTPEQLELAIYLTRLFLFSPLLLGLGGLAMAALNGLDRFTLPALAPAAYNLSIILGASVIAPWLGRSGLARFPNDGKPVIEGVAWGVVLGALLYLLCQLPGLWRAGYRYAPTLGLRDPAVRKIGKLMAPRLFGQAALQINIIVMSSLASTIAAARLSALDQAYQLMLLPHGIFALSLATVMFPAMSRAYGAGDLAAVGQSFRDTLRRVQWTVLPAAAALAALSVPLVRLLLERGSFDNQSTALVAEALVLYASALPAFAASEVLIRTFYAMQDTKTPVLVGVGTIVLNIGLSIALIRSGAGHRGLALAFSVANNLEAALLLILLRRRLGGLDPDGRLRASLRRSLLGAAGMALLVWGAARLTATRYPFVASADAPGYDGVGADFRLLAAWMAAVALLGGAAYAGLAALQGAEELAPWRERIMRRLRRG
ncbi:MAG TPA: murein biosynthesis integral membrane protein MurJ [Herpetosiphonaceae bacterium]